MIEQKPFYTVNDIAEILGIYPPGVRRLIREQKVKAEKLNGGYIVTPENLEKLLKERGIK